MNAYEVMAGIVCLPFKNCVIPDCFRGELLTVERYRNLFSFNFLPFDTLFMKASNLHGFNQYTRETGMTEEKVSGQKTAMNEQLSSSRLVANRAGSRLM